jgi:hypothetical protein
LQQQTWIEFGSFEHSTHIVVPWNLNAACTGKCVGNSGCNQLSSGCNSERRNTGGHHSDRSKYPTDDSGPATATEAARHSSQHRDLRATGTSGRL